MIRIRNSELGTLFLLASTTACSLPATSEGDLARATEPSICGSTIDWQNVESYDGSLGPSVAFVDARERPVGIMRPAGCSGTLIGRDLFLTAGHCLPGNDEVSFNFQLDPGGNPRAEDAYDIVEILEDDEGGLDYAIVRLDGNAGDVWGVSRPAVFAQPAGQAITIIQHPQMLPKKVEGGTLSFLADGRVAYGDLDTENGSSGSGVLQNVTGSMVGVHTSGTNDDSCSLSDPNKGESMEDIWAVSPIIRQVALDSAKLVAAVL